MSENLTLLESEESVAEFFEFYNELTQDVFNLNSETEEFLKLKSVKFVFFSESDETYLVKSDIKFDDDTVRCAYLLRYSVLNSYSTFKHFQNVYNCNSILELKEVNTARICCLGGGAGTEVFAVHKVFSDFFRSINNEEHQHSIKLYFTVIDICNKWENWILSLVKKLRKCGKTIVDVKMRFIQADVTKKWGENVLKAVQKADILTMVKFLSALNLSEVDYEKKKDLRMLEKVVLEMKLNSRIFILDYAGGGLYKRLQKNLEKYQYLKQCQSFLHQCFSINKNELEISGLSSSFMFNVMYVSSTTTVSSGTWQKCIPEIIVKQKTRKKVKKFPSTSKPPLTRIKLEKQKEVPVLTEE